MIVYQKGLSYAPASVNSDELCSSGFIILGKFGGSVDTFTSRNSGWIYT